MNTLFPLAGTLRVPGAGAVRGRAASRLVALVLLLWAAPHAYAQPQVIWIEGESAAETNFPEKTSFSPHTFRDRAGQLSGGDWLTSEGKRSGPPLRASYVFTPAVGGWHDLWSRKFWKHGPFTWRITAGDALSHGTCDRDPALYDSVPLRTHLSANWVHLGQVQLEPGVEHTLTIELLAGEGEPTTAGLDCFVLAQGTFLPRGRLKPGERLTDAEPGKFAFDPGLDPFTDDALVDLRPLNEGVAGQRGPLQRDGDGIRLGDGTPVRFWAVNFGREVFTQPQPVLDYMAGRLAKLGVNMVRAHGPVFDEAEPSRVDPARVAGLQRTVAAMRREGIYTTLSVYFPLWMKVTPACGLDGFDGFQNQKPFGLIYFNPRMQELHRHWLHTLLTTPNPATGLPLGHDPAVGIIEIVNEDSLFFWTFSKKNIPPPQWEMLERQYGLWLIRQYGSLDQALAAWGERAGRDDDPSGGRLALFEAWSMTRDGLKRADESRRRRVGDQVRFLTELQRGFYQRTVTWLRDEVGYKGLIVASNWTTADNRLLDPLERYSYTPADVIDHHGYFQRDHEGEGAGWSVREGHTFRADTVLGEPTATPIRISQTAGYPTTVSEVGWITPTPYRAEQPFLLAAYGALQGIDGIYHFAITDASLLNPVIEKFPVGNPAIAGTFPATALMYRRGDVAAAEPVVHQALQLTDLYALRGHAGGHDAALDELRAADVPVGAVREGDVSGYDPLSFFVGPVQRSVNEGGASRVVNTADLIRREQRTVTSRGGELTWDWGRRVVRMDTPRCQGVTGFVAEAGEVRLGDVTITVKNAYASVVVIALDDVPLRESRRVLVQAMTTDRPLGYADEPAGEGGALRRITSLGVPPIQVERIKATVALPGEGWRGQAADGNGYAQGEAFEVRGVLQLPEDALYTVLTR